MRVRLGLKKVGNLSRPESRISLSLGRSSLGFFRTIPKSWIKADGKSSQTKRHFLKITLDVVQEGGRIAKKITVRMQ